MVLTGGHQRLGHVLHVVPPSRPRPDHHHRWLRAKHVDVVVILHRPARRTVSFLTIPFVAWCPWTLTALRSSLIRYTGDYKYTSYAAIPIVAIGTGLLAKFRTPDSHVGLLVMCQVLNGIATGVFAQTSQLAIMTVMTHQEIAVGLALWGLFGSIGAAIGNAIAGAIWTNILPGELLKYLPEDKQDLMPEIYGSLDVQQEYPIGEPIRDAIIKAYAVAQHKMVIAGSAFVPVLVICVFMFKNINVKKLEAEKGKQTKGNVF